MEVYGLTGGIGSGKSTVAAMLEDYGIPVVTADELSRMVVAPGSDGLGDVVEAFGAEVLDEHGELDRKKMGQIVLAHADGRRQLESILHPRIRERYEQVLDALEKAGHRVMVYEVPLLFEKKLDQQDEMRAVILVSATADTRIARLKARDAMTTDDVIARMRAQMPEKDKRARANYVIHNDGNLDDLRVEVERLLAAFLRIPSRPERRPSAPPAAVEEIEEIEEVVEVDEVDEVDEVPDSEASASVEAGSQAAPSASPTSTPEAGAQPQPAAAEASGPVAEGLEVELHPASPTPSTSGAAWIPAGAKPAPGAQAAPTPAPQPAQAPAPAAPAVQAPAVQAPAAQAPPAPAPPAPSQPPASAAQNRQRMSTVPQLEVPDVTAALAKELLAQKAKTEGEPNS